MKLRTISEVQYKHGTTSYRRKNHSNTKAGSKIGGISKAKKTKKKKS